MQFPVQHGGGRASTETKTEDRLQRHRAISGGFMPVDAEPGLDRFAKRLATQGLASLGPTEFQDMATRGMITKIMVETDNPMDFSPRQVQGTGNHRFGGIRYTPEFALNFMQDR